MYAVVQKETEGLPTVISKNNKDFPDFIMSGYEIIHEGCKRDCEDVAEKMLQDVFCID